MRLIYFSRDYTTHDHRFLSALAKTGHKIYFLRLERRGHQLEERPIPPEIEQVPWSGGQTPAGLRNGLRLLQDLKRVIAEIQPDLIQAGPIQRSAFLVALSGFRPLVGASWGYDLLHDAKRNALWGWVTRYTLKRSAVLVGDCNTIRQIAISYGMPDERIITFPWGVDIKQFSPALEKQIDGDTFTLLSTRGWEQVYGVDIIARAFVQAARERSELHLTMLGNGSQAAKLRRLFQKGGVSERVSFPGQVGQSDLPRYYQHADLYVTASHSDGTSISLLEAMACGRPVLVSDIPGNREWVTPGVQGWLFPDGDVDAMACAILHAYDERARLSEMGLAARQFAEQRANWEKNFQELLKAYELALQAG